MTSADFEQKKRSVINTLNSVLRTGALKDQDVGQQRLVLLVDQLLERAGPKGPLPLAPVYEYLKERNLEEDGILETLLVLKEREGALDLPLELPPLVEQLPKEKRQRLLLRYQKRQQAPRTKVPPPSETSLPVVDKPKARGAGASGRTKALAAAFAVVAALGVGTYVWLEQTGAPVAAPVVIDDPNGLPCTKLTGNQGVLFCWVEKDAYEKLPPAERKTRALATKAAAAGLGYGSLQVWTAADQKLREVH